MATGSRDRYGFPRRPTVTQVLLTNDDGYTAEGIQAARTELLAAGMQVSVLAPDTNRSGSARAVTVHKVVTLSHMAGGDHDSVYACTGSPVDCVRIGVFSELFPKPDIVVSGINHGVNVGDDATYSATLGAAIEGALLGCPAVAFSQQDTADSLSMVSRASHSFRLAWLVPFLVKAVAANVHQAPRVAANVNFPNRVRENTIAISHFGTLRYDGRWMSAESSDESLRFRPYLGSGDPHPVVETTPRSDGGVLMEGQISFTPLSLNWARPSEHDQVQQWANAIIDAGNRALSSGRLKRQRG